MNRCQSTGLPKVRIGGSKWTFLVFRVGGTVNGCSAERVLARPVVLAGRAKLETACGRLGVVKRPADRSRAVVRRAWEA
jgi:hypothetical protein